MCLFFHRFIYKFSKTRLIIIIIGINVSNIWFESQKILSNRFIRPDTMHLLFNRFLKICFHWERFRMFLFSRYTKLTQSKRCSLTSDCVCDASNEISRENTKVEEWIGTVSVMNIIFMQLSLYETGIANDLSSMYLNRKKNNQWCLWSL